MGWRESHRWSVAVAEYGGLGPKQRRVESVDDGTLALGGKTAEKGGEIEVSLEIVHHRVANIFGRPLFELHKLTLNHQDNQLCKKKTGPPKLLRSLSNTCTLVASYDTLR